MKNVTDNVIKVDFRKRVIEERIVSQDEIVLFQTRVVILDPVNGDKNSEWKTNVIARFD